MLITETAPAARRGTIFGLPRAMIIGLCGVLVFLIGDGLETGYLAAFLTDRGFEQQLIAITLTIYGISAAVASWLAAALSQIYGPRKVMYLGAAIFLVLHVGFIAGIVLNSYPLLLASYAIRGFGYPMVAYAFLVWITSAARPRALGTAVGAFWFFYSAGFAALAPLAAGFFLPMIGPLGTLWVGWGLALIGTVIMIFNRDPHGGRRDDVVEGTNPVVAVFSSLTLLWEDRRVAAGAFIRMVNSTPQFGFIAFMPIYYTSTLGFELQQWLTVSSVMFISNILFNLLAGWLGDRVGLARVVRYMGSLGCAVTIIGFWLAPEVTHSYPVALVTSVIFGATLAGFVPLSALMPLMHPERHAASIACLNLGSGLAIAAGPAIVAVFYGPLGAGGVMAIFAGLYASAFLLSFALPTRTQERALRQA